MTLPDSSNSYLFLLPPIYSTSYLFSLTNCRPYIYRYPSTIAEETYFGKMSTKCFIIGDSRVRALSQEDIPVAKFWSIPGAKLYDLYDLIDGELAACIEEADDSPLVYVMAGICNLTYRIKRRCKEGLIDEVIVQPKVAQREIVDSTLEAVDDMQRFISRQGGIPVITTIFPMAIADWNQHRLNSGKTVTLTKADSYAEMHCYLEDMLDEVNSAIIETNRNNKVLTPLMHKCLEHNRGRNKTVTKKYNLLNDGCHPSPKLAKAIGKSLSKTIVLNRARVNSD